MFSYCGDNAKFAIYLPSGGGGVIIVVVMLSHCLQSTAHCACKDVAPDSDAAALLVTPLLSVKRLNEIMAYGQM